MTGQTRKNKQRKIHHRRRTRRGRRKVHRRRTRRRGRKVRRGGGGGFLDNLWQGTLSKNISPYSMPIGT